MDKFIQFVPPALNLVQVTRVSPEEIWVTVVNARDLCT